MPTQQSDRQALFISHSPLSRPSLVYRKKGQLAQLVRESDLFFRVKRQIKTVLTNVVVEQVKSRMNNAKTRHGKSVGQSFMLAHISIYG